MKIEKTKPKKGITELVSTAPRAACVTYAVSLLVFGSMFELNPEGGNLHFCLLSPIASSIPWRGFSCESKNTCDILPLCKTALNLLCFTMHTLSPLSSLQHTPHLHTLPPLLHHRTHTHTHTQPLVTNELILKLQSCSDLELIEVLQTTTVWRFGKVTCYGWALFGS